MKNFKLYEIKNITESELKKYKLQKNIKRNREISGFENIIIASDQDLD